MNILAVDDEPLMLWQLTENLKRIFEKPEYRVSGFDEVDDVMEWLDAQEKGSIAYAFLDIKLRGMSGIELAKDIRERSPETKVIFCTAYSDYAMEAFSVHAVGYLLKPVSEGDIRDVLRQLDQILTRLLETGSRCYLGRRHCGRSRCGFLAGRLLAALCVGEFRRIHAFRQ